MTTALILALSFGATVGCDETEEVKTKVDSNQSAEQKAVEKKAAVNALLKANGFDPETIAKNATAKDEKHTPLPGKTATGAPTLKRPAEGGPSSALTQADTKSSKVVVLSSGSAPHQVLRYQFKKGRTRKFVMEMVITPKRTVDGQPDPSIPPVQITMKGKSITLNVHEKSAERENTFLEFIPSAQGLPPEMLAQMTAQFAGLKGIQLLESVSVGGQILDTRIKEGTVNNPQVVALMQNLQDGMSNAFLALPEEAVGPGAKWQETTHIKAAGLEVTQVNVVELLSIKGNVLKVALQFKQSAGNQQISAPGLPPGAKVELVSMQGGGKGSMTVDLATLVTDSKVELNMNVDTKISGVGTPKPVSSATDTNMKIHMLITQ